MNTSNSSSSFMMDANWLWHCLFGRSFTDGEQMVRFSLWSGWTRVDGMKLQAEARLVSAGYHCDRCGCLSGHSAGYTTPADSKHQLFLDPEPSRPPPTRSVCLCVCVWSCVFKYTGGWCGRRMCLILVWHVAFIRLNTHTHTLDLTSI